MGFQQQKQCRPATASSTEPLATQHIRDLNRKHPYLQDTDPYSEGMNLSRHAMLDAQSVAQNVKAHEHATLSTGPVPSQTCKCGCKHASTPALAVPPSPTPLQAPWPYHVWYTQPAIFNGTPFMPSPSVSVPSLSFEGTPAPAHTMWYLTPTNTAYPLEGWPYAQFYPPPTLLITLVRMFLLHDNIRFCPTALPPKN